MFSSENLHVFHSNHAWFLPKNAYLSTQDMHIFLLKAFLSLELLKTRIFFYFTTTCIISSQGMMLSTSDVDALHLRHACFHPVVVTPMAVNPVPIHWHCPSNSHTGKEEIGCAVAFEPSGVRPFIPPTTYGLAGTRPSHVGVESVIASSPTHVQRISLKKLPQLYLSFNFGMQQWF